MMNTTYKTMVSELLREHVISDEIGERIIHYYTSKKMQQANRVLTIFAVFGSLLIGAGIILMLAHNWDQFSKITKIGLSFAPMFIGYLLGGYILLKKKGIAWKESIAIFLSLAIGSNIAILSQVYHIEGSIASFLMGWILMVLPLLYVFNSHSVMLLIIGLNTYYGIAFGSYRPERIVHAPWAYLGVWISVLPFFIKTLRHQLQEHIRIAYGWLFSVSMLITAWNFTYNVEVLGFVVYMSMFGLLYAIGNLDVFRKNQGFKNGSLAIGSIGTVFLLFFFSFEGSWEMFLDTHILTDRKKWNEIVHTREFTVISIYSVLGILIAGIQLVKKGISNMSVLHPACILFIGALGYTLYTGNTPIILINGYLLLLGGYFIKKGIDQYKLGIANYGLLIISSLIICRFFDIEMTFILRGVVFITIGIILFITNYLLHIRQKKRIERLQEDHQSSE
ncbi:DUF2157 domain-containing protein [Aquimarina sp. TRL1]|uniref:DUF2157 domain-containing protein n=1 Tax=Aquimarina sp. (strain TRL1) TaxID=2736252 RepID=UPI00158D5DD2|nr:DUF2157 domain-containing protein [Aquimarina sp. TRL1]QKX03845.1 DUF2157 domain-containing protein [Aquimarina sp. TRL1]